MTALDLYALAKIERHLPPGGLRRLFRNAPEQYAQALRVNDMAARTTWTRPLLAHVAAGCVSGKAAGVKFCAMLLAADSMRN